jgi:glycosyl transferase family 87
MRALTLGIACALLLCAPPASAATRPPHFWHTAAQAVAIADHDATVRRLAAHDRALRGQARVADLGLWLVTYRDTHGVKARVQVEDRTGDVLEQSPYAYPRTGGQLGSAGVTAEIIALALAIVLLGFFFDFRRPLRWRNADLLALLSLGAAVAFFDRGQPLLAVPLVYPPLLYLGARLALLGFRREGGSGSPLRSWASDHVLLAGLAVVVLGRIAANLLIGGVGDVGYASVFGAASIHEGWPLYVADHSHLDTYGPITYLAYLPFELIWPLHNLLHGYLPAAHAAAITFDLLTIGGLFVLGSRLRDRRLGLMLALAWAACPFTFLTLIANTNDGLVPLFVVAALVAFASPARRGIMIGLGAAAKFAPLALGPLFARVRGRGGVRGAAVFALSVTAVIAISVLAYAPHGDLGVVWSQTLGFQLNRHSFFSIWGQYPQLHPLQVALQVGVAGLALAAGLTPARGRSVAQVGALSGAILIGLQLTTIHWFFFYVVWFTPGVLLALFAVGSPVVALDRADRQPGEDQAGGDDHAHADRQLVEYPALEHQGAQALDHVADGVGAR